MRFLPLWIVLSVVAVTKCNNSTSKEFLDLNNVEDNAILWGSLFRKLNNVLSETEKLNQRLDVLSQRQGSLEERLSKIMENVLEIRLEQITRLDDISKKQDAQDGHLMKLTSNIQEFRTDEKRSQLWTTIQRRQDGSVDFYRNWNDYKNGFGNPDADYFIGLERIHQLTTNGGPHELLIILIDFENQTRYAKYDLFRIGSEEEKYAIKELGLYSGDAGDGMAHHRGQPFSTRDQDNNRGKIKGCADNFQGAWWFYDACYSGHLNGPYRQSKESKTWGVSWHPWRGWNVSMKYAAMLIRPKV